MRQTLALVIYTQSANLFMPGMHKNKTDKYYLWVVYNELDEPSHVAYVWETPQNQPLQPLDNRITELLRLAILQPTKSRKVWGQFTMNLNNNFMRAPYNERT